MMQYSSIIPLLIRSSSASQINHMASPNTTITIPVPMEPLVTIPDSEDPGKLTNEVVFHDGDSTVSMYEKFVKFISQDPICQKEYGMGKRVGYYKIGKELGHGNFSKVRVGVHGLTRAKVAVKIIEKAKLDYKSQKLLAREISNMQLLHHPNVINLFEVVENLSRIHLVVEYAPCGELYNFVIERRIDNEDVACHIFIQVISAVKFLHDKMIIHRDIKAENVLMVTDRIVKLGDLGFSTVVEADSKLSTFCGSPPYAAPELFKDDNYDGPSVDVWALGILVFFLNNATTPFKGDTVAELKAKILLGSFTLPQTFSESLKNLVESCLIQNVSARITVPQIIKHPWLIGYEVIGGYDHELQIQLRSDLTKGVKFHEDSLQFLETQYGIPREDIVQNNDQRDLIRSPLFGIYNSVQQNYFDSKFRTEEEEKHDAVIIRSASLKQILLKKVQSKTCNVL